MFWLVDLRLNGPHWIVGKTKFRGRAVNIDQLLERSGGVCEICGGLGGLVRVDVTASDDAVFCEICVGVVDAPNGHWRALEGAAWAAEPAVQIAVWRKLGEIGEAWATDAQLGMMMEPDVAARAAAVAMVHKDANGAVLANGDTVVLIKDLPVKGAGFTAKRGTAVRSISLVQDNAGHIEGRVEGQRIVILTEFVKRK